LDPIGGAGRVDSKAAPHLSGMLKSKLLPLTDLLGFPRQGQKSVIID
jgi:hypothetical protein